jgi:tetratricopeptide (TPR) repeat protein
LGTLGIAQYRVEQYQEAIETLQTSAELKLRHGVDIPRNLLFTAMAHWQLDQKDEALESYDKAIAWKTANDVKLKADAELKNVFAEAAKLMAADTEESKPDVDTEAAASAEESKDDNQQSSEIESDKQ